MKKIKLILLTVLILSFCVFSAEKLDFSKKRNFYFGEGEYGSMSLEITNFETFDYQEDIKKPFVLKKLNNSGLIEIIYDARTLSDDLSEGKSYSSTFYFTKKVIGKKEGLTVTAVYRPEIRFLVHDSLYADFVKLNFTPEKKSETVKVNAVKNLSKIQIENPKEVVTVGTADGLSFVKGLNDLVITLAKEENFEEEVIIYRKAAEGKINVLYLVINSSGFETAAQENAVPNIAGTDTSLTQSDSAVSDSVAVPLTTGIENTTEEVKSVNSSGFSLLSIIIIGVMTVIILALLVVILRGGKGAMYDKYKSFFDDVASLLRVNTKGTNIDKSIDEIMMILLDKFESNVTSPEEKPAEKKTVLKKPVNLKSPAITIKKPAETETSDMNIDLDFGNTEKDQSVSKKSDEPLNPKPASGGKKISRGFDFLDEEN